VIVTSVQQGGRIEVFGARGVVKDRDATLGVPPVVMGDDSLGGVSPLDVPRQHGHGQGATMAHELGALIGARRLSRMAARSFQSAGGMALCGVPVPGAKGPLGFAWVLGVDMVADTGFAV
jgi:hypothetical protein